MGGHPGDYSPYCIEICKHIQNTGKYLAYLFMVLFARRTVLFKTVLDLVSQVRDVVLMNVYLDLEVPGGLGFWNEGYMGKGREMGRSVYEQPGNEVDGSYHSKEGSK
jgi:hypothetical protein